MLGFGSTDPNQCEIGPRPIQVNKDPDPLFN